MTSIIDIPPTVDISIYRNDTEIKTVRVKNRTTRQLEDLTGVTALMQLRSTPDSATILYTFTTTIANNEITISIPQANWATITWTTGVYDLQLTYPSGVVETLFRGTLTVEKDVSR